MSDPLIVSRPDGRILEVRVSGPTDGLPLVFHHGTPGASTPLGHLDRAAHARGLRMVAVTRPGYGGSTRRPGRRVVDVVDDTAAVLDALGLHRCVVAGWSGGGPHALACAARLPGVVAALTIAGVGPDGVPDLDFLDGMGAENVEEFGAARAGEDVLRPLLEALRPALVDVAPADIVASMVTLLPPPDVAVLTDEFGGDLAAAFHDALRVGVDGWLDDDLAFAAPWGFDLGEIAVPTAVWQGTEDLMVPVAHGRWLATHVPGAAVHVEEGGGHLSIALGAVDRMLDGLVAAASAS